MNCLKSLVIAVSVGCLVLALAAPAFSQDQDLEALLGATDIFQGLNQEQLARVAALAAVRPGAAGEALIVQGGRTAALYTLQSGHATITLPDGTRIYEFGPGIVVGEFEFVSGKPAFGDVILDRDSVVVEIEAAALRELMDADTALGYGIMGNMAYKLSTY